MDVLVIHDLNLGYHRTEKWIDEYFKELELGWKALDEIKRTVLKSRLLRLESMMNP